MSSYSIGTEMKKMKLEIKNKDHRKQRANIFLNEIVSFHYYQVYRNTKIVIKLQH